MKRILWVLAAVAVAVAALLSIAVMLVPRDALRARMGEQIAAWTGRDVSLRGEPELRFFPRLTVTLNDVRVAGPAGMEDAEILSMERLTGQVRLLPLVIGRVEIGSFEMVQPVIRLVHDHGGARNWVFDSGAAALQLAFAGDVPLGEFIVEDATILYENRINAVSERLDVVNLELEWPSVRQPLTIAGSGTWRGESVSLTGTAREPFEFMNGAATSVDARFDSASATITFDGDASGVEMVQLSGALSMSTPSLREFVGWLGGDVGPGAGLGPASLAGTANLAGNVLSVERAALALDGNSATGALGITIASRPEISGTVDFAALDLSPYFAGLAASLARAEDWRKVGIDTGWFGNLVADIRLSAASVRIGTLAFGNTAASVLLKGGRMEVGLAGAAFDGGRVTGALTVTDMPDAPEAGYEMQLRATAFDVAEAAPALGLPEGISGSTSIEIDATATGHGFDSLVTTLGGEGAVSVEAGAVPLFGVAEIARAAEDAAPQTALAMSATPVDSFSARLAFGNGSAHVEQASVAAADFAATATGRLGLLDGALNLRGTVQPSGAGAAPRAFEIGGTLGAPQARPQALAN